MRDTTLCTAMHEAGHAVAQLAHPPAPFIDAVTIVDLPAGLLGRVETQPMWQPYMADVPASAEMTEIFRGFARKDVLIYLAGTVAEMRWRRYGRLGVAFSATSMAAVCFGTPVPERHTDLGCVRARLLWAFPDNIHGVFREAWIETEEIIAQNWRAVKAIGRLVHARGRISGEELDEVWERERNARRDE